MSRYLHTLRAAGQALSPQEMIVSRALVNYCFEPSRTRPTDFTPTQVLYVRYRRYADGRSDCPPELMLNVREFGAALRRVFTVEPSRKSRRMYDGAQVNGYIYVRGPGSVQVRGN